MMFAIWVATSSASDDIVVDIAFTGAHGAAIVLASRFGVAIDYEDPLLEPHREVGVYSPNPDVYLAVGQVHPLKFSYRRDATADQALNAMLAAWNATPGAPGTPYRLEVHGATRRLIPTTHTLPDGTRAPWRSPLDCEIALEKVTGRPEHRVSEVLRAVSDQCGASVAWVDSVLATNDEARIHGSSLGRQLWMFPAFRGPARDALDDLSKEVGGAGYMLHHSLRIDVDPGAVPHFLLYYITPDPSDDALYNLVPLVGPPRERVESPPFDDLPWDDFVRWWRDHHPESGRPTRDEVLNWPSLEPGPYGPHFGDYGLPPTWLDPDPDPTQHPPSLGVPAPK